MSIDGGVPSDYAIGAHDASFDGFAGLHDRELRDHPTQRKIHGLDWAALLMEHDVCSKLHRREPRLHALEFVSRKLPKNAVLYDVF
jgi:hypothetical protein